jgi:hypothetical protein
LRGAGLRLRAGPARDLPLGDKTHRLRNRYMGDACLIDPAGTVQLGHFLGVKALHVATVVGLEARLRIVRQRQVQRAVDGGVWKQQQNDHRQKHDRSAEHANANPDEAHGDVARLVSCGLQQFFKHGAMLPAE